MHEGNSWPEARLGDLSTFIGSGVTPRGGSKVYTKSGIPFLRSQNVHFGGLRLDDVAFISPNLHAELDRTHVQPGDVLLNITGASIGRCTTVPKDLGPANVNQHVCIIRTDPTRLNGKFLAYLLESRRGQAQVFGRQAGLSREALNYEQVRSFSIALPSLSEQRKIADIFSSLEDTLEKTQAIIDQLEVVKNGLLWELLTKGIGNPKSQCHKEFGVSIPIHWQVLPFDKLLSGIDAGWSPQCESRSASDGEWGVLKVSAVSSGRYIQAENKALPKPMESRPDLEVRQGDVLIARANGVLELVGRSAFVHRTRTRLMLSDKTLRLRPLHEQLLPYFLHLLLGFEPVRTQVLEGATGSHMRNISQSAIRKVIAPIPPLAEQKTIADTAIAIEERIAAERESLTAQKELKASLLDSLLSGQIRPPAPEQEAA